MVFKTILVVLLSTSNTVKAQFSRSASEEFDSDGFWSDNFRGMDDMNFDNFEFMPEFDFDSFFRKIDAPPLKEAQERRDDGFEFMSEPSESFPKPSFASEPSFSRQPISFQNQEKNFGTPTFYNGQRYSDMISSRVSNEPEPIFVDPVKPSNERYDSYEDQVPYQEQSIRRLDGPFEPYVPPKTEEKKPKRTLLKVKIKKPVDKLEERRDSYPSWRPPIQPLNTITEDPIKYQKYQEDPKYEYNDDEYYYDQEYEYEEYKPNSYSKYEVFTTEKPQKRDSYYDSPSIRYPSYKVPPTTRYPTYSTPVTRSYPNTPEPVQIPEERQSYEGPRYPNTPVTRSYPTYNTPEPVPIPEGPNYEGPRFTVIKDAQDRQSHDFGSGFEIPTFFKSSFEAPAFAEFNPPFGNSGIFIDFLKTAGAPEDPFESTPFSARVESKTINTESSVPEIHRYGAFDTTSNTIPFGYAKTEPGPPGFYSTLLYTTPTTVAPSTTTVQPSYQPPKEPEQPKYKPKEPSYQPPQEPSYKPKEPSYQPPQEPSYQPPQEPSYQPPQKPEEPKYKPEPELPKYNKPTYRPPIKAMKPTTENPPETTTELEKPTESSVYYKPPSEGDENQELTPGPVYYKPLDDDSTTTTSTTTIKTSTVDNDSFSAPKAPKKAKRPSKKKPSRPSRPRKVKKPFLKMPSLKFPKLPKPSALIRRPSKKSDHRPPRPKSVQNRPKPRPKSDLAPPKKEFEKKPKKLAKQPKKPKSHSKLLGSISEMMKKPIHRKGPSVAQSTGVLLPYVLSFLH